MWQDVKTCRGLERALFELLIIKLVCASAKILGVNITSWLEIHILDLDYDFQA